MKMSVGKKLLSGFFAVLLLLGIIAGIGNYAINEVNKSYSDIINNRVKKVILVKKLQSSFMVEFISIRGYLLTGDPAQKNDYDEAVKQFEKTKSKLLSMNLIGKVKKDIIDLDNLHTRYKDVAHDVIDFKMNGDEVGYLSTIKTKGTPISKAFNRKADELVKFEENLLGSQSIAATKGVNFVKSLVLILSVIAFVIGSVLAFLISRSISKPISIVVDAIKRVSNGDLTIDVIKVKNRDEIGTLVQALNMMVKDLKGVIDHVSVSSLQVASSSEELAASAEQSTSVAQQISLNIQESASGMERQLKQVQKVSSALERMDQGIQYIAQSSNVMLESASQATSFAEKGDISVDNVVKQIEQVYDAVGQATKSILLLEDRSKEIGKIISLITNIANQTNLLALNAAIEAARAGEQGKGFAVVADEVRKLAEESKYSADQIAEMVSIIQQETRQVVELMENGNKLVTEGLNGTKETSSAFMQISQSINEVSNKANEVTLSVTKLANGSKQIMDFVGDVNEITEINAAASQESSAATQEQLANMEEVTASATTLAQLSEELQGRVSRFKVSSK
jgi:methyl-accepting chemotaxis protein